MWTPAGLLIDATTHRRSSPCPPTSASSNPSIGGEWQDANFNALGASPLFNYTFARHDDVVKFGFTVNRNAPPAPASAPMYGKEL